MFIYIGIVCLGGRGGRCEPFIGIHFTLVVCRQTFFFSKFFIEGTHYQKHYWLSAIRNLFPRTRTKEGKVEGHALKILWWRSNNVNYVRKFLFHLYLQYYWFIANQNIFLIFDDINNARKLIHIVFYTFYNKFRENEGKKQIISNL